LDLLILRTLSSREAWQARMSIIPVLSLVGEIGD
jgi:hypothetical protein